MPPATLPPSVFAVPALPPAVPKPPPPPPLAPRKRLVSPAPLPPWLVLHDQFPPAPGVVPLAFASRMPAIDALPCTAITTGSGPITRKVAPELNVKPCNGSTTTLGPLAWVCTTGVGAVPHQLLIVAGVVVVSTVVVPQLSVVVGVVLQLIGLGSKLLVVYGKHAAVIVGSLGQPSMQSGLASPSVLVSGTPQPQVP